MEGKITFGWQDVLACHPCSKWNQSARTMWALAGLADKVTVDGFLANDVVKLLNPDDVLWVVLHFMTAPQVHRLQGAFDLRYTQTGHMAWSDFRRKFVAALCDVVKHIPEVL